MDYPATKRRSRWWYLLPIFFGIIGGVIGYFVVRNDDPPLAKGLLYVGIIMLIINIVLAVIGFMTTDLAEDFVPPVRI